MYIMSAWSQENTCFSFGAQNEERGYEDL